MLASALGVTTWIFGDTPLADIAPRLAAWGYDGVVLPGDLSATRAAEVHQVLEDHGLTPLGFTPPNVDLGLDANTQGAGRVDAYAALKGEEPPPGPPPPTPPSGCLTQPLQLLGIRR